MGFVVVVLVVLVVVLLAMVSVVLILPVILLFQFLSDSILQILMDIINMEYLLEKYTITLFTYENGT